MQGRGSQGGNYPPPPNFLSQWDGYACAPPLNFGNHQAYVHFCPPPPKKKIVPEPLGTCITVA